MHPDIVFCMLQLRIQQHPILVVMKNIPDVIRNHQYSILDFVIFFSFPPFRTGFSEYSGKKWGLICSWKVLQLRVLYLNLLFICFDFKILHFIHHLVEGGAQLLEFLHASVPP